MVDKVLSSWLTAAVAEARVAMPTLTAGFAFGTGNLRASREHRGPNGFSEIVEQVRFTKKFVLTYHAFTVGVLMLFTLAHWTGRLQAARMRRDDARHATGPAQTSMLPQSTKNDTERATMKYGVVVQEIEQDASSSSGSSTLEVDNTLPTGESHADERAPLLKVHDATHGRGKLVDYARAALMYQPAPIAVVNKTLPPNGTSLFIICFLGVNAFYLLFKSPLDLKSPFAFADRAGVLFVVNLPLLYLLAAKNQPLKFLTGYSYESLNIFHRRLGELLCLLALFHAAGMVAVWWAFLRPLGWSFAFYLTRKIVLLGLFAFISYEVLYFTSLGSFRQRWYELFLVTHVVLQIAALLLLWFHHHHTRPYVGIALAIFLVDRLIFRMLVKTRRHVANLTVLDSSTVKISAPVQLSVQSKWSYFTRSFRDGWKPTDHVFLTVPVLSKKHLIQAHPFTIASAAPSSNDSDANLDLFIRAKDGFSRDLLRYAVFHKSATVRLDGPYGSQHPFEVLSNSRAALVVVGGSGIAVAYPLLRALLSQRVDVSDEEAPRGSHSTQRVGLIWIVREEPHKAWLGDGKLDELRQLGVEIHLPKATAEAGRPDVGQMVQDWVECGTETRETVGVVCCGPDEMSRTVRNACAGMVLKGHAVRVQIEKFGW